VDIAALVEYLGSQELLDIPVSRAFLGLAVLAFQDSQELADTAALAESAATVGFPAFLAIAAFLVFLGIPGFQEFQGLVASLELVVIAVPLAQQELQGFLDFQE